MGSSTAGHKYLQVEDDSDSGKASSRGRPVVPLGAWRYYRYGVWGIIVLLLIVLYIVFLNVGWVIDRNSERFSRGYSGDEATTIVLLGDSLIGRPFWQYDLGGMIRRRLEPHNLVIWNEGVDGNTIQQISDRLDSALSHNPAAVILLWDSDCSDTNETLLNATEIAEVRATYTETLTNVVNATLRHPSVQYVAISGPGLLGENDNIFLPKRFVGKGEMLDSYRDLNKAVARGFEINYLDIRKSLEMAEPFFWPFYRFWTTKDGEHLNYAGTCILADLVSAALGGWLDSGAR